MKSRLSRRIGSHTDFVVEECYSQNTVCIAGCNERELGRAIRRAAGNDL
jgi:hypothetical protein